MAGEDETRCAYSYRGWDGAVFACVLRRGHPSKWSHQLRLVVEPSREAAVRGAADGEAGAS